MERFQLMAYLDNICQTLLHRGILRIIWKCKSTYVKIIKLFFSFFLGKSEILGFRSQKNERHHETFHNPFNRWKSFAFRIVVNNGLIKKWSHFWQKGSSRSCNSPLNFVSCLKHCKLCAIAIRVAGGFQMF